MQNFYADHSTHYAGLDRGCAIYQTRPERFRLDEKMVRTQDLRLSPETYAFRCLCTAADIPDNQTKCASTFVTHFVKAQHGLCSWMPAFLTSHHAAWSISIFFRSELKKYQLSEDTNSKFIQHHMPLVLQRTTCGTFIKHTQKHACQELTMYVTIHCDLEALKASRVGKNSSILSASSGTTPLAASAERNRSSHFASSGVLSGSISLHPIILSTAPNHPR